MNIKREKPILFNSDMVRAILDGRKTQTRRVVKPQPDHIVRNAYHIKGNDVPRRGEDIKCPYGQIGDVLWVRETTEADHEFHNCALYSKYSADNEHVLYSECEDEEYNGTVAHWWYSRDVCPSIHMPKWASRIKLKITDIRVEQLQSISTSDIKAEGIQQRFPKVNDEHTPKILFGQWMELWQYVYGAESWNQNPWVWVIEFKRI